MANWSQNVSGSINFFGPQPSTKFGTSSTFGVALFGDGASGQFAMPIRVLSWFSNPGSPVSTDSYSFSPQLGPVANTMLMVSGPSQSEKQQDGSGKYFEVLAGGATNDELAFTPVYTPIVNPTNAWTALTTSTVTWVTQA